MIPALALTVLRQIPPDFIPGLLSGAYSLHGGVLRNGAGRIVAHLVTSGPADLMKSLVPGLNVLSGLVGNGQLFALSKSVEALQVSVSTVLNVAAAGTAFAGLGLVASVAGSAFVDRRLKGIEGQLRRMQEDLDDLKRAVVTHHLASLKAAMDNLRHAEEDSDGERKRGMLLDAKRDFQVARHYYLARLKEAESPAAFEVLEECLTVATVGAALTASELGMFDTAAKDFQSNAASWQEVVRGFAKEHALSKAPEQLLDLPPTQLSASDLVELLDFASGETLKWSWIDEFRSERMAAAQKNDSWFSRPGKDSVSPVQLDAIRVSKHLLQRSRVLEGLGEHFSFLASNRLSARTFTEAARGELARSKSDALCLLYQPNKLNAS